jgi:hypothetical protein
MTQCSTKVSEEYTTSVFTEVVSQVGQLFNYIGETLGNVKVTLRLAVNQFVLGLTSI